MSPTPRTNALIVSLQGTPQHDMIVPLTDLARQLERDLTATRERLKRVEKERDGLRLDLSLHAATLDSKRMLLASAETALTAAEARVAEIEREGMVMVPREPTEEMTQAAMIATGRLMTSVDPEYANRINAQRREDLDRIYKAMLTASQQDADDGARMELCAGARIPDRPARRDGKASRGRLTPPTSPPHEEAKSR